MDVTLFLLLGYCVQRAFITGIVLTAYADIGINIQNINNV